MLNWDWMKKKDKVDPEKILNYEDRIMEYQKELQRQRQELENQFSTYRISTSMYEESKLTESKVKVICSAYIQEIYDSLAKHQAKSISYGIFKQVIKFFQVDYSTGESILELVGKSESDELVAINMLLGVVKEKIKQEIKDEFK